MPIQHELDHDWDSGSQSAARRQTTSLLRLHRQPVQSRVRFREIDPERNGAFHADLNGSLASHRFRPQRFLVKDMHFDSRASFWVRGRAITDLAVVDVSSSGMGLIADTAIDLKQGTVLQDLRLEHKGHVVWSGDATVMYAPAGRHERFGIRLLGRGIELTELRFRDDIVERQFGHSLIREDDFDRFLPADWRANVTALFYMLHEVRSSLDAHEANDPEGRWRDAAASRRLCEIMHEKVWPAVKRLTEDLDATSMQFDARQTGLGLLFAQRILTLEFTQCEFMNRAYTKPRGYAGDYRMMELGQSGILSGDTLYQRFLQYYIQHSSLGCAIRDRGEVALAAAREVLALDRPVRILSLACGPAIELRRLIAETECFHHPVEFVLIDQDEDALRSCVEELNRAAEHRDDVHMISFHCLHFSLRQILAPRKGSERALVEEVLSGVDLIYSMGLFDYIEQSLARKTARRLFKLLKPGGRLLIGNLSRVPDSTWIMEFGLAWHLVYRDRDDMLDMGSLINTNQGCVGVEADHSGNCLFLDVRRQLD
jgi:extracellular factor (EF) 3-hydroxypalmitic acid methyl ester biosynthesis protein